MIFEKCYSDYLTLLYCRLKSRAREAEGCTYTEKERERDRLLLSTST